MAMAKMSTNDEDDTHSWCFGQYDEHYVTPLQVRQGWYNDEDNPHQAHEWVRPGTK